MEKNMPSDDETVIRRTPHSKRVTATIVDAVGEATDTDPQRLPPLGEIVDPDSVDHLFSRTTAEDRRTNGYVTFDFAGCVVLVDHDDRVIVLPQAEMGAGDLQ